MVCLRLLLLALIVSSLGVFAVRVKSKSINLFDAGDSVDTGMQSTNILSPQNASMTEKHQAHTKRAGDCVKGKAGELFGNTGFRLNDCLGAGQFGEAWSARSETVNAVLKIAWNSDREVAGMGNECQFARLSKRRAALLHHSEWFTDCIHSGTEIFHGEELHYVLVENGNAPTLGEVLEASPDDPPIQLKRQKNVIETTLKIFDVANDIMFPLKDSQASERYLLYHHDFHEDNVLIDSRGIITFIDYGHTTICCAASEHACVENERGGAEEFEVCNPNAINVNHKAMTKYLFQDFIRMLIKADEDTWPWPDAVGNYVYSSSNGPAGEADEAISSIESEMREAYKADWAGLGSFGRELLSAFLVVVRDASDVADGHASWPPTYVPELQRALSKLVHGVLPVKL